MSQGFALDPSGANDPAQTGDPARTKDPAPAMNPAAAAGPGRSEPIGSADPARAGLPLGDPYDWYRRGLALLGAGNAEAAALLLARALDAEPGSRSVAEALGRACFGARRFSESAELFAGLVDRDPTDDYARFGLGLALTRLGRHEQAVVQLTLAAVMKPARSTYAEALRQARATVDARRQIAS